MIVALDTDVIVNWAMEGAPHHRAARRFLASEVEERRQLGLVPQVLYEFIHVSTDARRFENPLSMEQAILLGRELWDGNEVVRLTPGLTVLHRALDLLTSLRLGRKRTLDTVLAATLEAAGVRRFATFNGQDFRVFPFLEVVTPE